ncbi:MAG TPA: neutral/alkaline non-lysosomal ceramidase N-terminal domain-containing protein [Candidatus Paceibacterota bacterium]|nr:neutral/alkaline non-lysosomal ceramidase N-terminal domain-containing protein [Verrucomicrobiota bacterium]HRY48824.1 neutral/alkaline non-lysosomal ceramidase N-terminal domain-containing protein [Candidatus Paceibacterota bacterium]HRZ99827.1 neutral/alkaline non-lysosomal ceramidase N-terminal domain-containing protein [Candidatus Paceibacterota bacterium]
MEEHACPENEPAGGPSKRPVLRWMIRSAAVVVLLLAMIAIACLDSVDYEPYFNAEYFRATTDYWRQQAEKAKPVTGDLRAGFARTLLTPGIGYASNNPSKGQFKALPLAGYGQRQGRSATGVHDDLYVKAVAFQVGDRLGIMVAADALIIPRVVTDIVLEQLDRDLKLSRAQVYFSATHTHSSLGGWGEGWVAEAFAGGYQPEAISWFADRLAGVVRAAVADLSSASIGHGRVARPEYVRNRLVGERGRVDPELSFALVRQSDGDTAVLGSYAAHATVLPAGNMEWSGDYPGCWQRAVEKATGGIAIFLAGGMGSHSPVAGEKGFVGAERMGNGLAQACLDQLPGLSLTNRIAFAIAGLEITLPEPQVRISDAIRLRPWLARRLLPVGQRVFLQVFRFQDWRWVSTPCDFSGELALEIKDFARSRGFQAVITSFNGDYVGYVIPSRYYHLEGYEPRLMSFFGPNLPDYFEEWIRRLMVDSIHPTVEIQGEISVAEH